MSRRDDAPQPKCNARMPGLSLILPRRSSSTNMPPAQRFDFPTYHGVIAAAGDAGLDLVLVGGQAVGYYGSRYQQEYPALDHFAPYLSKDADLLGTVDDGYRLAAVLKARWEINPRKGGMQGLSLGKLTLADPPHAPVELLGRILGADANMVRATAYHVNIPGHGRLNVINPFLLYCVKGNNAVQLSQSEPGRERQDSRQFAVMSLVVKTILRRFSLDGAKESVRSLINPCGRLLDFWLSDDGAVLVAAGVVDPAGLLPMETMSSHPETSVRNFVEKRLPVFFNQQLPSAIARVPPRLIEKVRADFLGILDLLHSALDAGSAS